MENIRLSNKCTKYEDVSSCEEELKDDINKVIECNYCKWKEEIEGVLNKVPGYVKDIWLSDFVGFMYSKLEIEGKDVDKLSDKEILPYVLDLLGKLLKERKIKVDIYGIEEYDKPREIEKVMFGGKWRKKYITSWVWKKEGELDPCEINSEQELKDRVEEWKNKTYEVYKYVLEKYGKEEADILFDILEIRRAPCYEGKIDID